MVKCVSCGLDDGQEDSLSSTEAKYGMIEIESKPIHCRVCNQLLVMTYVRKNDFSMIPIFIYCAKCVKTLEDIQKQLSETAPKEV